MTVSEPSSARRAALARTPARPGPSRTARTSPASSSTPRGEADEFDAALSRARRRTADERGRTRHADGDERRTRLEADPDGVGEVYADELAGIDEDELDEEPPRTWTPTTDAELAPEAVAAAPARAAAPPPPDRARAAAPPREPLARFTAFLRASWAELQRVQWPDRRQVAQATAVVLGFVVVAGLTSASPIASPRNVVDLIL